MISLNVYLILINKIVSVIIVPYFQYILKSTIYVCMYDIKIIHQHRKPLL